ncbi:MAG: hypothetical protein R3B72_49765 [Polyangiaceae bacterium]
MKSRQVMVVGMFALVATTGCSGSGTEEGIEDLGQAEEALWGGHKPPSGYNLSLEDTLRFTPLQPGADATHGRELFGVAANLVDSDPTFALFEGISGAAGGPIVSNGRTCFTCHRGSPTSFGMPPPPISQSVPTTDPLFTGIDGDAQGDPRAAQLLEDHGLFKLRPNRFNPQRPAGDPFREVFFWRKSPALVNVAFSQSFLTDGRGRHLFETDRGAVFSHTQAQDERFDDLFPVTDGNDLDAFQKSLFTDTLLAALLDPAAPMHDTLADDPFYTVPIQTPAEHRGKKIFEKKCMTCHDTPNVFGSLANVSALGDGLDPDYPVHAPSTGRTFNIGVSERNKHGLQFTRFDGQGGFAPVVVPLARDDGSTWHLTVTMDIGLAATTGRAVDVGRFKVPQLRNIKNLAPYFHDNSADTLEEVVDYFDSPFYNQSPAGKRYPIHLSHKQKADLLAFLELL